MKDGDSCEADVDNAESHKTVADILAGSLENFDEDPPPDARPISMEF